MRSVNRSATSLIKKILRESFPGVAFSVRVSSGSGYSAYDVRYTDGPLASEVDPILSLFKNGDFNAMEDLHEYDGATLVFAGEVVSRAKYCSATREESAEVVVARKAELAQRHADDCASNPSFEHHRDWLDAWRERREASFGHIKAHPSSTLAALTLVPSGGDLAVALAASKAAHEARERAARERKELDRVAPRRAKTLPSRSSSLSL